MRRKNPLKDKSVSKAIIIINKAIPNNRNNITFDVNETKSEEETV